MTAETFFCFFHHITVKPTGPNFRHTFLSRSVCHLTLSQRICVCDAVLYGGIVCQSGGGGGGGARARD